MWFGGLQRPEETESDFPEVVAAEITKSGKRAKFLREYFSGGLISSEHAGHGCFCAPPDLGRFMFLSRRIPLFWAVFGAASACMPGFAQENLLALRLTWLPGHLYTQETTTETTSVLAALGKEDQKMRVVQTTDIRVQSQPDGGKLARVTFRSMKGEVMLNGMKQAFDSDRLSDASPMIRDSIGRSVGRSFGLLYDVRDRFVGVQDTADMASLDNKPSPSLEAIAEAGDVAKLYQRSLEMGLPKTAVKVADRWTTQEKLDFPSAGPVGVELRSRLEAVMDYDTRRHAKISFEGEMKRADDGVGSRRVTIGDGSKVFGQVLFDLERGTVSFAAFRADIQLEVDGKSFPVRQQVTTKLTGFKQE